MYTPPHPKLTHQLLSMVMISRFCFPRHGSRENNHCFGGLLRVPERARTFVIITVRSGSEAASLSPVRVVIRGFSCAVVRGCLPLACTIFPYTPHQHVFTGIQTSSKPAINRVYHKCIKPRSKSYTTTKVANRRVYILKYGLCVD